LVSDELWAPIETLISRHELPGEKGGRPPLEDRAALTIMGQRRRSVELVWLPTGH